MYELPLPAALKTLIRSAIPDVLWRRLKEMQRQAAFDGPAPYSFDEPAILRQIDAQAEIVPFFVDIGAQDGVLGSQTLGLAKRGWSGISYEADASLFEGMTLRYKPLPLVKVRRQMVMPNTIADILKRDGAPDNFGFLNLDIDSFDYYVLHNLLESYSPSVICVEINEMIPPPIVFAVEYHADATWSGDRFQGFSIQAAKQLCHRFGYTIGELHYNNLLLVKAPAGARAVSDEEIASAYRTGYADRADRDRLFPWNTDYSDLLSASPEKVLQTLTRLFGDRLDRCHLSIGGECEL